MATVTITIDDELVEKAQAMARTRGLTLEELLRRHVEDLAATLDRWRAAEEFGRVVEQHPGRSPEGWKFNREEAHERGNQ